MTARRFLIFGFWSLVIFTTACGGGDDPAEGEGNGNGDTDDDIDDDLDDDDSADGGDDDTWPPLPDDDADDDDADDDVDDDAPEPDYDLSFEGFGADTTGGAGGEARVVTSLADSGPGTLREAVDLGGPAVVTFDVDGVIDAQSVLDLPSDLTVDARGRDVVITTNGFRIAGESNILLMNLAFVDVSGQIGDAIQIADGAHHVVVFHCRFDNAGLMPFVEDIPDELISVVWGSHDINVSWCRFDNHDKVLLAGNGDAPEEVDNVISVTLHNNVFTRTGRRHPFLRWGRADVFNNIVRDSRVYLSAPSGMKAAVGSQILAEANWYEEPRWPFFFALYPEDGGWARAVDNVTVGSGVVFLENEPDQVFTRPYAARVDRPTPAWYAMMEANTGNTMPTAEI